MVRARNVNKTKRPKAVPDWEQESFESRTDIKKAAQAVTDLGEKICELPVSTIKTFDLPQDVLDAVLLLKKLDKGPAIKRQKAYIGKILRKNEPLIVQIKERFQVIENESLKEKARFHRLENWRDRLVSEGDAALEAFLEKYPHADRNQLRQWMRSANTEATQNKPPKSSRAIFQYIKSLDNANIEEEAEAEQSNDD